MGQFWRAPKILETGRPPNPDEVRGASDYAGRIIYAITS